jgi:hypothetical protein
VTVTVTTMGASAGLTQPQIGGRNGLLYAFAVSLSGPVGLALLVGLGARRKRHSSIVCGLAFLLLLLPAATLVGCGGSSASTSGNPGTPAGTYALTITANFASGTTSLTRKSTLTLVVQ